jgi:hypothetical protein
VIEQLGAGLEAWRMPVSAFDGNCACLKRARVAWNLGKWIARLALPNDVVRWGVEAAPSGIRLRCRPGRPHRPADHLGLSAAHRWHESLVAACVRPQTSLRRSSRHLDFADSRAGYLELGKAALRQPRRVAWRRRIAMKAGARSPPAGSLEQRT